MDGAHVDILPDSVGAVSPTGAAVVKVTVRLPRNRWSYSRPTDQFGAKPTSMPVPIAPPQRVSLADRRGAPVAVIAIVLVVGDRGAALHVPEHVVPGIAGLAGEQAESVDLGLVGVAGMSERLALDPLRSAQSPWASRPNTQLPICQR